MGGSSGPLTTSKKETTMGFYLKAKHRSLKLRDGEGGEMREVGGLPIFFENLDETRYLSDHDFEIVPDAYAEQLIADANEAGTVGLSASAISIIEKAQKLGVNIEDMTEDEAERAVAKANVIAKRAAKVVRHKAFEAHQAKQAAKRKEAKIAAKKAAKEAEETEPDDEDGLSELGMPELREMAKELGAEKLPPSKAALVELIEELQTEPDDEDGEE